MKSTFYLRPANLGKTRRFFQAPRELDALENRPTRLGKKAIQCDSKIPKLWNSNEVAYRSSSKIDSMSTFRQR